METIISIKPGEIEAESFRIIDKEMGPSPFDPMTHQVVRRVIHATGDFTFAQNLLFHPEALAAGIAAIRAGMDVLTDVNMVASGVSKGLLGKFGGSVFCRVADPEVATVAMRAGQTRSEAAMEIGMTAANVGIVAIGNAPTALLKVMEHMDSLAPENRPRLIVGAPVGFVNAAESKALLAEKKYPFITCQGRKGGSPVAAAIVNALIRLALEQ